LDQLRNRHAGEWNKVVEAMESDISGQTNVFKAVDLPATLSTVVEILLADEDTPTDLKDYAKMVINPPSRDRPKKGMLGNPFMKQK
jgi:hypothetical protein